MIAPLLPVAASWVGATVAAAAIAIGVFGGIVLVVIALAERLDERDSAAAARRVRARNREEVIAQHSQHSQHTKEEERGPGSGGAAPVAGVGTQPPPPGMVAPPDLEIERIVAWFDAAERWFDAAERALHALGAAPRDEYAALAALAEAYDAGASPEQAAIDLALTLGASRTQSAQSASRTQVLTAARRDP